MPAHFADSAPAAPPHKGTHRRRTALEEDDDADDADDGAARPPAPSGHATAANADDDVSTVDSRAADGTAAWRMLRALERRRAPAYGSAVARFGLRAARGFLSFHLPSVNRDVN